MLRIGTFEIVLGCLASKDAETLRSALSILSRLVSLADRNLVAEVTLPVLRCLSLPDAKVKRSALKILQILLDDGM
jgi:hypothetical protein